MYCLAYRTLLLGLVAAILAATADNAALAQERAVRGAEDPLNPCGIIYGRVYGPYDYRTERDKLQVVEDVHFTAKVELLRGGERGFIGGDLDYTLHSSPNHHRALASMAKLSERDKKRKPDGARYPVECYFDRAVRFRPEDTKVRVLYAQFLHKNKQTPEALRQLEVAQHHAGDDPVANYNIGLVYYQLREYDRALMLAHKAKQLGLAEEQLEKLLKREGKWKDPPP